MQDFAPPPEYASSPERQSVAAAECGVMAGVAKIKVDQVETVATEDEPEPEEQQDIATLQVLKEDAHQQEDCHQDPVYIPGLPPLQQKVKRKRKKKPRVKGDSVMSQIQLRTSSESEIKEIETKAEDKDDFEEIMNFIEDFPRSPGCRLVYCNVSLCCLCTLGGLLGKFFFPQRKLSHPYR